METREKGSKKATPPGHFVSCDQLVSRTQGLVGKTSGNMTKNRYWVVTVFVDHFSGLDFVHFQESMPAEETIKAKEACEHFKIETLT